MCVCVCSRLQSLGYITRTHPTFSIYSYTFFSTFCCIQICLFQKGSQVYIRIDVCKIETKKNKQKKHEGYAKQPSSLPFSFLIYRILFELKNKIKHFYRKKGLVHKYMHASNINRKRVVFFLFIHFRPFVSQKSLNHSMAGLSYI